MKLIMICIAAVILLCACTGTYRVTMLKDGSASIITDLNLGTIQSKLSKTNPLIIEVDTSDSDRKFKITTIDSIGNYIPDINGQKFRMALNDTALFIESYKTIATTVSLNTNTQDYFYILIHTERKIKKINSVMKGVKVKGSNITIKRKKRVIYPEHEYLNILFE